MNGYHLHNVYAGILDNYGLSTACYPSFHNVVSLSMAVTNFRHAIEGRCNVVRALNCICSKT